MTTIARKIVTFDVLGVPISATNLNDAAAAIESWAQDRQGRFVCIRDVASLMGILEDPALSDVHHEAAMITPDGMPLVMIGKLRGVEVSRTCGPDLMDFVLARSPRSGLRHYFYGGKEGVAQTLADIFQKKYPGVQIAGYECPPFRTLTPVEKAATVKRIIDSRADVVWVGISSPKQEAWMRDCYRKLPQTLIGVGAAFDFHSGSVKRAPVWMQKSGLEWLYRLLTEPKRLWRRYLILAPRFVWAIVLGEFFASRTTGKR